MRTVRVSAICLKASFGIILILLTAAPPASAQLVNQDADRNWVDRPTDPVTQRRNVTYWIDDPPAEAPAGSVQAVRDAIAGWNEAQDYPGGIRLTQASDGPSSDIRVSWRVPGFDWGTTSARAGGTGQRTIRLRTRDQTGGPLNAEQIENMARHEFGHAEGLRDNTGSDVMKPRAQAADLIAPDFMIGTVDVGAKRSLYFNFWDSVRPLIDDSFASVSPAESGFLYTYDLLLDSNSLNPVSEFSIFTLAEMQPVSLPSGWDAVFLPPAQGEVPSHFAPGLMVNHAAEDFELFPGSSATFTFFSPGEPENGWIFARDVADELTELGERSNIFTPGPLVSVPDNGSTAMLLGLGLVAIALVHRKKVSGASSAARSSNCARCSAMRSSHSAILLCVKR